MMPTASCHNQSGSHDWRCCSAWAAAWGATSHPTAVQLCQLTKLAHVGPPATVHSPVGRQGSGGSSTTTAHQQLRVQQEIHSVACATAALLPLLPRAATAAAITTCAATQHLIASDGITHAGTKPSATNYSLSSSTLHTPSLRLPVVEGALSWHST